jgi:hypothetical protein
MEKIFNNGTIDQKTAIEFLKNKLVDKVPFVRVESGCIGDRLIMLLVSFDKKETWSYGYVENSNYFRMSVGDPGVMEVFCQSIHDRKRGITYESRVKTKFRKCTVKSLDVVVERVLLYVSKVQEELSV